MRFSIIIVDLNMLKKINNGFGLEKLFVVFSMIIVDINMLQINNFFGLEKNVFEIFYNNC